MLRSRSLVEELRAPEIAISGALRAEGTLGAGLLLRGGVTRRYAAALALVLLGTL